MKTLFMLVFAAMLFAGSTRSSAQETAPTPTVKEQLAMEADSLEARRRALREEGTMLEKREFELKQEIADLTGRLTAAKLELKRNKVEQKDHKLREKELKMDKKEHKMDKKEAKRAAKEAKKAEK